MIFLIKEGDGLMDWSVVLDSYSIFLYLGVCASIVTHCSNSYGSIFIISIGKKMRGMNIKIKKHFLRCSVAGIWETKKS